MVYTKYKNNFDFLVRHLPYYLIYSQETQNIYTEFAKYFDGIDKIINKLKSIGQIDFAEGVFLDDLGAMFSVARNNMNDVDYRKLIKLEFNKQNFVPNINQLTELIKSLTLYNPSINVGWEVDGEPGRYDIDIVADESFNFELINKLRLDDLVGGGIKINQRNCIENWDENYYINDLYIGDVLFPMQTKRNPICDFKFSDIPRVNDIYMNDINFTNDERRKINE